MIRSLAAVALLGLVAVPATVVAQSAANVSNTPVSDSLAAGIDASFEEWMKAGHVPGVVYGVVKDGKLVWAKGLGVQDVDTRRPVTADSRFRIASMSKAFTALAILKLRDEGKLSLDAPAERYVPELKGWKYPTSDARRITVADLLHHNAGFVEDNPWGDRMQPLSEADFTKMLKAGVPFAQAPGLRMEYSNFGYALLGRIVTNVSGRPYQDYIGGEIMRPLGMTATGYDVFKSPAGTRALGYRWQDNVWVREPDMADGTFGAMGGVETTANDYAKWVTFLLSAWPARDGADAGPVKRATVRGIVEGANFVNVTERPRPGGGTCRMPIAYAKGWQVVEDCDLGRMVTHSGGYPGYGSLLVLLPDAGVGVFAFANRTYAGPRPPVMAALNLLREAGLTERRALPVSDGLTAAYSAAKAAWRSGDPGAAPLAINVPLDRELARRKTEIAELKNDVGTCTMTEEIKPISAMEGTFLWACERGKVQGRVQRAPTPQLSLQVLDFGSGPK